jgi:hypothetical protein
MNVPQKPEKQEKAAKPDKPAKQAPIRARHIEQAQQEIQGNVKRTRQQILQFFEEVTPAAYPPEACSFAEYLLQWAAGKEKTTDKRLRAMFDAAAGYEEDEKPKAEKKAEKAVKGKATGKAVSSKEASKEAKEAPKKKAGRPKKEK